MAEWQRPAAIPYPKIWGEFERLNPINNEMQSLVIKDIPENFLETVITALGEISILNAPNELRPELLADQVSIEERNARWRIILKQRLSLMCVLKQTDGRQQVVAVSINERRSRFDGQPEFQGKFMKWTWSLLEYIYGKRPFYTIFGVTEVIINTTNFTMPDFIETQVPLEMINCRNLLCKATGVKLSLACFEIKEEQNPIPDAAVEAGAKQFVQVPYEELASVDRSYRPQECKMFKLMYNFNR